MRVHRRARLGFAFTCTVTRRVYGVGTFCTRAYAVTMTFRFDDAIVAAVLHHMNDDHTADNLLIVRAFGEPEATSAVMTGFTGDEAMWTAVTPDGEREVTVGWLAGSISERPAVRREVVALYDEACARLGVEPRPHA